MSSDTIHIAELELSAHIGVPDEERCAPQRLTASLVLEPIRDFRALDDSIENAVDYFVVSRVVQSLASERPRKLIETLAQDIATHLLERFPLRAIDVEVRKFILPDTAHVAVRIRRESSKP